ncbi:HNH endonuclease [Granulicella cerasi]|uniref:HNH endonuclease n=1 Tax=Granulicella cerasi TaxID=741063 RepID=A0ABW1ZEY3_9BACT|nr:HNH endonuclease [Granulicella cerasi]
MQQAKRMSSDHKKIGHGKRHHTTTPVSGTAREQAIEIRAGVFRQPAMQTPVLVLNASYEPINICGARRALVLVLKGVARTEEQQGSLLHSHRLQMQMPSVIRLLEYRRIPHQTRALSRKNILLRDRNTCQYCQVVQTSAELTLDHVLPRSRGGLSTWENLVACCKDCNRRKGNTLLHDLHDMKLLREPRPFSLHTSRHIMRMIGSADANWRKYLYFENNAAA